MKCLKVAVVTIIAVILLGFNLAEARMIQGGAGGGSWSSLPDQTTNPSNYGHQTDPYQYQVDDHHYYVQTGNNWSLFGPPTPQPIPPAPPIRNPWPPIRPPVRPPVRPPRPPCPPCPPPIVIPPHPPVPIPPPIVIPPHPPVPIPVPPPPPTPVAHYDYSDAPVAIYGVAKHRVNSNPYQWFGNSVDTESGTGHDPEDATDGGISILTALIPGYEATAQFVGHSRRNANEQVRIWIDWQHDGFQNAVDQIYHNAVYLKPVKTVTFNFTVPTSALLGPTWLRARITCQNHLDPTGYRSQGEVEDHRVDVVPEPGSMMLLGSLATGLFGFAGIRKKFKKGGGR